MAISCEVATPPGPLWLRAPPLLSITSPAHQSPPLLLARTFYAVKDVGAALCCPRDAPHHIHDLGVRAAHVAELVPLDAVVAVGVVSQRRVEPFVRPTVERALLLERSLSSLTP